MRDPFARDAEFRKLLDGKQNVDLALVNLEIARDASPDLDLAALMGRIEALADRVGERCPVGSRSGHVIGQINWVLFVEEEFQGNEGDYYDPRNSYLNEVLDRKLGIPISLSILYQAVANRVGLPLAGVNLPAHFLLRDIGAASPLFVDPFHGGRTLDLDSCQRLLSAMTGRTFPLLPDEVAPCEAVTTVSRMLRNLKSIYLERQDFASALPACRRLAALNPRDLAEVRDWGTTSLRANRPGESLGPLGRYVAERPEAPDIEAIRSLLRAARREVAQRN